MAKFKEKPLPPELREMAQEIAKRHKARPTEVIDLTEERIAPDLLGTGVCKKKKSRPNEQRQLEAQELRRSLQQAVTECLSEREQAIIAMLHIDERSCNYVAKELRLQPRRVKQLNERAMVRLRHYIVRNNTALGIF